MVTRHSHPTNRGSYSMRTDRVAGSTLTALGLALLGGCAKAEKPAEQAAAAVPAAPAPAARPTVHVVAGDFSFQAPDTLAAGPTDWKRTRLNSSHIPLSLM